MLNSTSKIEGTMISNWLFILETTMTCFARRGGNTLLSTIKEFTPMKKSKNRSSWEDYSD